MARALPLGPVLLEFEHTSSEGYRDPRALVVRRVLAGTPDEWERERTLAPLLPALAASVAGFCALSSLAGWL